MNIAIIGGNVAGLAAAILIKQKHPQHSIIVYERKAVRNKKVCGNAISLDFLQYLTKNDIFLRESHYNSELLLCDDHSTKVTKIDCGFVIIDREELHAQLLTKARSLGIPIEEQQICLEDIHSLAHFVIVAAGNHKISQTCLQNRTHYLRKNTTLVIRCDGRFPAAFTTTIKDANIICWDLTKNGYFWLFQGDYIETPRTAAYEPFVHDQRHLNYGYGGARCAPHELRNRCSYLIDHLAQVIRVTLPKAVDFEGVHLSLPLDKRKIAMYRQTREHTFIGVGDAIGVAHPVLGAGIEPAWLTATLLADCTTETTIDYRTYQGLVAKNLHQLYYAKHKYHLLTQSRSWWFRLIPLRLKAPLMRRMLTRIFTESLTTNLFTPIIKRSN